jgi:transcriptional regulator with XRE-family HTH domain
MTGPELRRFRERLGHTQAGFAATLGISASQQGNYERGTYPIPRVVELACMAPAAELLPDTPSARRQNRKKGRTR